MGFPKSSGFVAGYQFCNLVATLSGHRNWDNMSQAYRYRNKATDKLSGGPAGS